MLMHQNSVKPLSKSHIGLIWNPASINLELEPTIPNQYENNKIAQVK